MKGKQAQGGKIDTWKRGLFTVEGQVYLCLFDFAVSLKDAFQGRSRNMGEYFKKEEEMGEDELH